MRPAAAFRQILRSLDSIKADPATLLQVRDLVRKVGADHGINIVDRSERVAHARKLLDLGVSRPTTRERLMARFNISKSEAYRVIGDALQLSQKRRELGTKDPENYDDADV